MKIPPVIAFTAVLTVATATSHTPRADGASPNTGVSQAQTAGIQGVWEAVEVAMTGPSPLTVKPQPNLAIFTATHYSRMHVNADRPRPVLADPAKATADELRATWGPFVAEGGSYEVSGDRITLRPTIAKNPAAVGTSIVYSYTVAGKSLRLTAVSDRNGPVRYPETVTLTRIE